MRDSKRSLECNVRAIDEAARTATFVAATETPVDSWRGREYLRIGGADLSRYLKNPVILDAHDRYTSDSVIGRGAVRVDGTELIVEATFADTDRANVVWQLIRGGFLRAVSVGFTYLRKDIKELADGEADGAFAGPGVVINKWNLYEISTVPVGADENALKRALGLGDCDDVAPVVQYLITSLQRLSPEPTNQPGEQQMDKQEDEARAASEPEGGEPKESIALGKKREAQELRDALDAISPRGCDLSGVIDECVVQGLDFDAGRKRLAEEFAKRQAAVGTPEPQKPETKTDGEKGLKDVSNETLIRALTL